MNNKCHAAFVINKIDSNLHKSGLSKLTEEEKPTFFQKAKKEIHGFIYSYSDHYHKYEYIKRIWVAAVLCFPFFGGFLGLGRFYLQHNWQGLLQLGAFVITLIFGLLYLQFRLEIYAAFLVTFGCFLALAMAWEIVDCARVLLGTLRPKYGGWR